MLTRPLPLVFLLLIAGPDSSANTEVWTGTVVAAAIIHEGGGEHPQKTTVHLRLVETSREQVAGGTRINLRSETTAYDVENAMHGLVDCVGKGHQTVSDKHPLAALLIGPGSTSYHLVVTRALYSFNCGGQVIHGDDSHGRMVGIGTTPPIDLGVLGHGTDVEVGDSQPRSLETGGATMKGAFTAHRHVTTGAHNGVITYDYDVAWELCRGESFCGK
jgi:hypothetical protein